MSQNLLELVQNYFGGATVRQASTALGESESSISTALRSILPLALGGLFVRSQQPGGTAELFGLANQAHNNGILNNLGSLLGGTSSVHTTAPATDGGLLNKGAELLRSVLGTHYTAAVEGVSQQAGVRESTTNSLLGMAVPVALGLLGKHTAENNLDANSFGSYLSSQRSSIMGALGGLPGSLGTMLSGLGLGSVAAGIGNTASAAANTFGNAGRSAVRDVESVASSPSRWPLLLLALAVLAGLFYFMRSCNKTPETAEPATTTTTDTTMTATTPTPAPAPTAPTGRYDEASGNYIYDTGANTDVKLPDGTVLNVGSNSFESRLFNFLNDNSQTVSDDKTQGWMSLDRVYFNTGKSTLTSESQAQLKNVAAILKAFPNATLKFGGYTDNKGKAAVNMSLSADRANAARNAVVGNGIDGGRITAEGYGDAHPIASNDTPEGRAQNRRVDVRVTKK
ncbi:OmpA family protein [Microvirga sp. STS02]|uniref:OmpA family protein n=1 Tax=Hymenobacter negativus TaxID=2795026 RepID=UPI0018DB5291|nr:MULTISPECIES: OmpA family protein [Bacteria]MBH8571005.1 OmpA family protein [Hymenobacter negativus]MBR7210743.1 OmpA family protein [Microvirga sp. STS02]